MKALQEIAEGIEINLPNNNHIIVKGILLIETCDLPAKCECLNFIQFNGDYGCHSCLCKGENIEIAPRSYVHIYPFENELSLRTSQQSIEFAIRASDKPFMGVKGHTVLSKIMPDFITGMAIDRMHCVDGGVVKKIMTLLFDQKYSHSSFSLFLVIDIINRRLISIKPPKFVHRMPRTVADLVHWKASELKCFFVYYSIPIFEGVMRADYFEHYLRLVTAITILSSDEITNSMIQVSQDLLCRFVHEFQDLYGIQFCSINIHLLLHLGDCVKKLGPLWAYTCYEYENLNGQLLKLINGTRHIDTQLASSQDQFIKMIRIIELLPNNDIRNFCLKKKKQVKIIQEIYPHCYSVGIYKLQQITDIITTALNNSKIPYNNTVIYQYFRLLYHNKLYVSKMYNRSLQTESSVVQYFQNNEERLGIIYCFIKLSNCNQPFCNCCHQHYAVICEIVKHDVFVTTGYQFEYSTAQFLYKCYVTNNFYVIPVNALITPCVYVNFDNLTYVVLPINKKEFE